MASCEEIGRSKSHLPLKFNVILRRMAPGFGHGAGIDQGKALSCGHLPPFHAAASRRCRAKATEPKARTGSERFSRRAARRCVVQTQSLAEIAPESTWKKLSTDRFQTALH
jgi:hypothetical protein